MKRLLCIILVLCIVAVTVSGCGKNTGASQTDATNGKTDSQKETTGSNSTNDSTESTGTPADLGDDSMTFGSSLDELNAYAGYFEGDSTDITVDCISGTAG